MWNFKLRFYWAAIANFLTVFYIISISTPYWIREGSGKTYIGIFETQVENKQYLTPTSCNDYMSELDCGLLDSAKTSAVVTVIFSGITSVLYSLPSQYFALFPKSFGEISFILQTIFSIITMTVFYYFKMDYYTDDGINAEYTVDAHPSLELNASFYIWVVAMALSISVFVLQSILNAKEYIFPTDSIRAS
jgi:uncharacterized membrane-anchored protein